MALEIQVKATPDVSGFEEALQSAAAKMKIKIPVEADTSGLDINKGSSRSSSSASSRSSTNKALQQELKTYRQLATLARQYDSMMAKAPKGFNSQDLQKVGTFLNTVRNSDGSFKSLSGDAKSFNDQLKQVAIYAENARTQLSKLTSEQTATNKADRQIANLRSQAETAIRNYNQMMSQGKLGFSSDSLRHATALYDQIADGNGVLKISNEQMLDQVELLQEFSKATRDAKQEYSSWSAQRSADRSLNREYTSRNNLLRQIDEYLNTNPNLINNREGYSNLLDLQNSLATGTISSSEASSNLAGIRQEMKALGLETDTLNQKIQRLFGEHFGVAVALAGVNALVNSMQQLLVNVQQIDAAMTELRKVTDETNATYDSFMVNAANRAQDMGATISDTIMATADAAKLGYDLDEAEVLADSAIIYKNVGDGIESIDDASSSLISTMKAFGIEAENSIGIVDEFNEVGELQYCPAA